MTMSESRDCLKYRMLGSQEPVGSWGHEYVRYGKLWLLCICAFSTSALTLLFSGKKSIWPIKNWVMRCWCCYLSGAKCRGFANGPSDATATRDINFCFVKIPNGSAFLVPDYPVCPIKEAIKRCSSSCGINMSPTTCYFFWKSVRGYSLRVSCWIF